MEQRWDLVKEWILSLWVIVAFPLFFSLWNNFVWAMWWRPRRIRKVFEEQKVPCLPSRSLYGNLPQFLQLNRDARALPMPTISHDIGPRIMPHLFEWSKTYGNSIFTFIPRLKWFFFCILLLTIISFLDASKDFAL